MPYTRRQPEKQMFEHFLFKCVSRPDLTGVPLIGVSIIWNHVNLKYDLYIQKSIKYICDLVHLMFWNAHNNN